LRGDRHTRQVVRAASTRGTSTPRTSAMAVITLPDGSAPGRPSSRRTNVMTDTPGAVTSLVASPAASQRPPRVGSSRSISRRYNASTPSAAASRGPKRVADARAPSPRPGCAPGWKAPVSSPVLLWSAPWPHGKPAGGRLEAVAARHPFGWTPAGVTSNRFCSFPPRLDRPAQGVPQEDPSLPPASPGARPSDPERCPLQGC
jgi:hypothetical protein